MKTNKIIFITILVFFYTNCFSQKIAQWRGNNRDGIYDETNLLKVWPSEGPKLLWHFDSLGFGHSSAAIANEKVYSAGTIDGKGFVCAFDFSGNLLWKSNYGDEWTETWPGVRTTPLVIAEKLYLLSGFGKLYCMSSENGDMIWVVDVFKDYDGQNIQWGITENLAFDEEKIFCTVGGKDANVIALNRDNGKLIWKNAGNGEKSAYCSPAIFTHNNRKIFVTMTESTILGIDAESGKLLWKHEQTNKYSVHANTPIYNNGYLYCVSGYGKGGVMLKLNDDGSSVEEVWRSTALDNRMGGTILLNDKIYGAGDFVKGWFCLDWKTGNKIYSESLFSKSGNIIFADGMLYCYGETGEIALVQPTDTGFKKISSFKVPYGILQHWAHLVINNGVLYVRHGNSLMAYSLK